VTVLLSPSNVHVGLIHLPAVPNVIPVWPGGVGQQRREPQHLAVDGDVFDRDAALGEQLLDVAAGQAGAQVPENSHNDHVEWEVEPGEARGCDGRGCRRRVLMALLCRARLQQM
jgi:hypothetical protein